MDERLRQALAEHAHAVLADHDLVALYLVGSRARDDFRSDSDVDVAVLPRHPVPDALGLSIAVAATLAPYVDGHPIDVVPLDLQQLPLLTSLLRDAVVIACSDESARVSFEVEAMTRTLEFEQHAGPLREELLAQTARGER